MYLSLNWIKDWLKLPKDLDGKQIGLDFTMATVEVEEVIDQKKSLEGVVVGKIEEITKHPDADRLQVCQVDIGNEKREQIVCGGNNLSKDMLVAVAKVGTKVKWHGEGELVELKKTKIRGVESNGMIVASSEVGLENLFPAESEKEIMDLSELKLKVGQDLVVALKLDDIVIDVDNKSINHRPDLWGQYGMARELAAIYKVKLAEYKIAALKEKNELKLKVDVLDKENCFRYLGLAIKNIKVAESPLELKKKLEAVGIRPINNIVDVTNYVMYELGQPMHAFDSRQIEGANIVVKQAKKGESFVTLDGEKRKLPEGALMICDSKKNVALAGIMGGQNSEISDDTTEIILESANFRAASIRKTSMALGLRTESSARFEKSLDPVLAETAIKKAVEMILELCPDAYVASKLVDVNNNPFKEIILEVPEELINKRFGVKIPTKEIKDILARLQFGVVYKSKKFTIKVPSFRATKDISIPEDIVEEVARVYGYDNIDATLPVVHVREPIMDIERRSERDIILWLAWSQAYNEVYNYPFSDQEWLKKLDLEASQHIKVKNSISPELSYLNISLLPNLFKKAEENLRWYEEFKIFELQRIFDKNQKGFYHIDNNKKKFLPKQDKYLSGVEVSKSSSEELFLSVKGLVESMMDHWQIDWDIEISDLSYANTSYVVKHQDIEFGHFGLLDMSLFDSRDIKVSVGFWELNFSSLVKYISNKKRYQSLPKFPSIKRDMAIQVEDNMAWRDIEADIYKVSPLIRSIELFDIYKGKGVAPGMKSLAYHLEFRSDDRTLLAEDVDELMNEILAILKKKYSAILR
ncbi:phenylalanine--tRNA ligase subunit beta [Candidatus Parcubacteria bacterium]|nr:MAG: phenylalanine--tRNA ligase subunit beta [Candidatus Parcubacteria bacterium]